MCLDKKWLEWWVIIECAIDDAWSAFKEIVFFGNRRIYDTGFYGSN